MCETDTIEYGVKEVIDDWRNRADMMEEYIEDPDEIQKHVIGDFRARANELEARVLTDTDN